jgi:flagellum-specific ATP synthase
LCTAVQRRQALQILEWVSLYQSSRTLIDTGLYAKGSNPAIDAAIERQNEIVRFLRQGRDERATFDQTVAAMSKLTDGVRHAA